MAATLWPSEPHERQVRRRAQTSERATAAQAVALRTTRTSSTTGEMHFFFEDSSQDAYASPAPSE